MDPATLNIVQSIATGYFTHFSAKAVEALFGKVFQRRPDLEGQLRAAQSTRDIEAVFKAAVGVIDAKAGEGAIGVDHTLLEAIRGIRFDHQAGRVTIAGSIISAPVLVTGGGPGATGQTEVTGDFELKSKGTSIRGRNASIKIRGNAQVKQT